MNIKLPKDVKLILSKLNDHKYEAYIVGGCVRDSLLGLDPHDWDICTSALPEQIVEVFNGYRVIPTGLKHGTVTVIVNDSQYEITTYRVDGEYEDNRHPKEVSFTNSLKDDLSRRDFTINAMAYNPSVGLIDYFNGQDDLDRKIIKCVGNPNKRFNEDALRILRSLRFSSTYGFYIEKETNNAIRQNVNLLNNISNERIQNELCKIILGDNALEVLMNYSDVISTIIPEISKCINFNQNNKFHCYDVYEHMMTSVSKYSGKDLIVKLALLLHDIGKPNCYTEDENGGHFYEHPKISYDIASNVLTRLRFDNKTKKQVLDLILYHDSDIVPTVKTIRKWLNKIGEEQFYRLIEVKFADIRSHAKDTQNHRINQYNNVKSVLDDVIESEQCFKLKDLNINGNDIKALGIKEGKAVGDILNYLFNCVISDEIDNDYDTLIKYAKHKINIDNLEVS